MRMPTISSLKDPAPALGKAQLPQENDLARPHHLPREARRGVAPGPPLVVANKDALGRCRLKGLGFCGVKKWSIGVL